MKKKSQIIANWPKYLLQWGVLAALIFFFSGIAKLLLPEMEPADPEKLCPMGGLQALATYLAKGSLPCSMTSLQIIMGIGLAAAVVLLSKLFCAFICPVGTVEDLFIRLRAGLGIHGCDIRNDSAVDKILRILKYALLFWIVYMTVGASELFCKKLDPYYAVATGFKGEITLWMSLTALALVVLPSFFIKRFWCKYICPLGAISNTLKFWIWIAALVGIWWGLNILDVKLDWFWFLGAFCLAGYLLEIISGNPKLQILHVVVDQDKCGRTCYSCRKACPYNIDVPNKGPIVTNVDCVLCGECVAACPGKALSISTINPTKCRFTRFLPAILSVLFVIAAYIIGGKFELPTIDESWGIEAGMKIETMKVENLKSVKCFGSSKAFKARMEKVNGVHGVKTYVGTHSVVIKYDPSVVNEEKIRQEIFIPSHFRVWSPDPAKLSELKIATIRVEKMYDKLDLNYLGLQFRQTGKSIFGVESEYNCPVIVRVYMSPEENLSEEWFREIVNKKELEMPVHGGGTKITPVNLEFVRLEEEVDTIGISEYLHKMFDPFKAEYKGKYPQGDSTVVLKRTEVYKNKTQYAYEISDQSYEKPIIKRSLPFLSNHISKEEGVIGTYLRLNNELKPTITIRFAAPMTANKIWKLINMETWTITYKDDEIKEVPAKLKFKNEGKTVAWYE